MALFYNCALTLSVWHR